MPTEHGDVHAPSATAARYDDREHVALVYGEIGDGEDVLVRVHSECLTGDVFGSLRCDCGPQLDAALRRGRRRRAAASCSTCAGTRAAGIGLLHKLQAYQLQDAGRATPSTPTSTWACRPTPATTAPARRSWPTSACARCGCSPTTRPSGPGWRATACSVTGREPLPSHVHPGEPRLPAHQARPDGPPARHHRAGDRGRRRPTRRPCRRLGATGSRHERRGSARGRSRSTRPG